MPHRIATQNVENPKCGGGCVGLSDFSKKKKHAQPKKKTEADEKRNKNKKNEKKSVS